MLYVKSIKGFEVRREKILLLCRVQKKHTTNLLLCRVKKSTCAQYLPCVFLDDTRQKCCLPCVWKVAHGKLWAHGKYGLSCSDT